MFVVKKENSTWARGHFANKTPVIKEFPVNKVAKIALYDIKNRIELLKKDGKWIVFNKDSYPADFDKIKKFMLKIKNMNIAQKVIIKKDKYPDLKLIAPDKNANSEETGTMLQLYDNLGNTISTIIFGKYHFAHNTETNSVQEPVKDGRFLKVINAKTPPVLVSSPFLIANPNPAKWLDKNFVNLKSVKLAERIRPNGETLWKISRKDEKSPYAIEGLKAGERPKPRKMFEITTAFRQFDFNDILPADTSTKITGLDKPETFIYESCNGRKYKFDISMMDKKAYLKMTVLPSENIENNPIQAKASTTIPDKFYEKWIYEIPRYFAKNLLITRDELISAQQMPTSIMGN